MALEKAMPFQQERNKEAIDAYAQNYGAHREGISMKEMAEYYTKWANTDKYEVDLGPVRYKGPELAAETICELIKENRENVRVLDIAAGTGFLGQMIWKKGFRLIDGLDPAEGMLEAARKKKVYANLICDFLTEKKLDIEEGTYDVAVTAGGFGEGHIPCNAVHEMIRIVKPGGYIVNVMKERYLEIVSDYKDRLEPLMKELEISGKWKRLSRKVIPNYFLEYSGVIYVYQKC
ncbi:methyltransferase-like protein 27 [Ostrea edulis]|uniref:methyltransferase-like protein 27 n=1 Tax=Ostrea edulis TaxID=37623 RepID=UPI0024AF01E4|nr:methyltransferase-like protein 27 [Ostrea edulis]